MLNFQSVLSQLQHSVSTSVAMEIIVPMLNAQTQMLQLGKVSVYITDDLFN